jgi:hypothetical protein
VKRLLAFFAGGFGLGALFGRRSRRTAAALAPADSPADELRARLAEARAHEPEAEPEPAADAAEPLSLEERRESVHERARGAIRELGSD